MAALSSRAIGWCGGRVARLPLMFFVLAAMLSAVGPGAVASTAMVAPVAMSVGAGAGIPPFLSALMVANGANAGNLSPISSVGLVVDSIFDKMGYADAIWRATALNFVGHALVTLAAFALFGGRQLLRRSGVVAVRPVAHHDRTEALDHDGCHNGLDGRGRVRGASTQGFRRLPPSASSLFSSGNVDDKRRSSACPCRAILMVPADHARSASLEKTGGLDLFSQLLADMTTRTG